MHTLSGPSSEERKIISTGTNTATCDVLYNNFNCI